MDKSGIYSIRNTANGKVYVGSTGSTQGFTKRWTGHKLSLLNNKHANPHLQSSWNKYGEENFEFSILEECADNMLIIREQAWMDYYDSMNNNKGYNLISSDRKIYNNETKDRISKSVSNANSKRIWSEESKQKLGKHSGCYKIGHITSKKTSKSISNANSKRIWSEESKQKVRDTMKRIWINKKLEKQNVIS